MYISFECKILIQNENAFQWDAYCPLVDRIRACTVAGGGYLLKGVYLPGQCTCPMGCTCPGGVPAQGEGVTCQGGTCPGNPPVDRKTPVKT